MNAHVSAQSFERDIALKDVALEIWQRRYLVASIAAIVTLIAIFTAMVTTPSYRATVLLAQTRAKPDGGLAGLASRLGGALPELEAAGLTAGQDGEQALAMLQSVGFTQAFLVKENILPQLYPKLWDASNGSWRQGTSSAYSRFRAQISAWLARVSRDQGQTQAAKSVTGQPSLWGATKLFNRIRSIDRDRRTQLVSLSITWRDPQLAAQWANALVQRVNEHARHRAINEAEKSLEYLRNEIQKNNVLELQQVLYRLMEAEQRKSMLATVREEYAFQIIDRAIVPEERIAPHRSLMVLSGLIGGALTGIFAVLFLAYALGYRRLPHA